jgi:DNA-binding LacI/PurR family transcriptional regulator
LRVTSLEVKVQTLSKAAVSLLIARMNDDAYTPQGTVFIDGQVVIKDSIAPPQACEMI